MTFNYPILFCLCGPSGSGKSTLCRALAASDNTLAVSISTTTRAPRDNEVDGVDYFFVSPEEFERRVDAGKFVEHAVFNTNRYGTETLNVERATHDHHHLLFDIEVEGVAQLKRLYPGHVVTLFVFPSSMAILQRRLSQRGTDSPEVVTQRLAIAQREIEILRSPQFSDYLVINDVLEKAHDDALAIIRAERLRLSRMGATDLANLLK